MSDENTTANYRMELLKAHNWMPWKRKMLAVLEDLGLDSYIERDAKRPESAIPGKPTAEEIEAQTKWDKGDRKARCRIELSISDAEIVHVMGARTAREMWDQLCTVKETKGTLGVLATRRALFRTQAEEGFDMSEHVSKLRQLQEELHIMGSVISDEDFVMILLTSLPESWENYASSFLGSSSNRPTVRSQELVGILMEEYRRRKEKGGETVGGTSLQARGNGGRFSRGGKGSGKSDGGDKDKECYNCHKKGHISKDCWAKGGGREGQGPKGRKGPHRGRSNQAREEEEDNNSATLNNVTYMSYSSTNSSPISKYDWFLDSGTTSHICAIREAFIEYQPLSHSTIRGVGKTPAVALGRGSILVDFDVNGEIITHRLQNVLHVPEAENCLLSLGRFEEKDGNYVVFRDRMCALLDGKDRLVGTGAKQGGLFLLHARARLPGQDRANFAASKNLTWDQWHRRFGHVAVSSLQRLERQQLVEGFSVDPSSIPSPSCEACIQAKLAHKSFPSEAQNRANAPGERVMSDVWGPIGVKSIGGWSYFITFVDDCKRFNSLGFLRLKSEAADRIEEHGEKVKQRFGKYPSYMRFDNGKELVNQRIRTWAAKNGIEIETTAPYSPSQNGVAERYNRTLLELARAMLIARNLPSFLWDEAVSYANYIRNRVPTRALDGSTPYEGWFGKKPDVSHLREFGCDVWILDEAKKTKLHPRSKKMVFVGFNDGSKSVRYYDSQHRSIKTSRNFVFNENEEAGEASIPGLRSEGEKDVTPDAQTSSDSTSASPTTSTTTDATSTTPDATPATSTRSINSSSKSDASTPYTQPLRRTPRSIQPIDYKLSGNPDSRKPSSRLNPSSVTPLDATESSRANSTQDERANVAVERLWECVLEGPETTFSVQETDLPRTFEEALAGPEATQWKEAMDEEMGTLEKMGTWRKGMLPVGRKVVGCRWVFTKKRDEYGRVVKFKARLVVQGFSQKPGVDYSEDGTFAPVMRFETLRTMLAFAAVDDLKLRQFDVKGAYLHGHLEEEIFMTQPPGYDDGSGDVCILLRSLYGLKQAGNVWNRELVRVLKDLHFTQLKTDYCCFIRREDNDFTVLLVWVDDFLAISTSDDLNDRVERELKAHFDVKSLGRPSMLLSIKVHQEPHLISLSQTHFIDKLLVKFGLQDANPVSTPMDPNVKLDDEDSKDGEVSAEGEQDTRLTYGYATLIGSLMYLALGTRPDIAYAVHRLAQFTQNPKPKHWTAVKRIFRYLKGTRAHKLTFGGLQDLLSNDLNIYCDADWASGADRKSISGYAIIIAGGAVAWSSKKQNTVALSTGEAEYVAATHVAKQVLWHRSLLRELNFPLSTTSTIFSDNQAALSIARHPEFHARTKHIDIAYHFLRDLVNDGTITMVYVNTEYNVADVFTKGLPRVLHENFTYELGVLDD
ncbi:hypothetical protein D9613_009127 [Agrocybe pediades]|uniref:Polyprotein n=1 Tax=Agrocybe pediades TaxID=84607 RepID=A0A8H4R3V9_9AGAR|nr:hypothetical protein D9613_009127 [Agrocybe pediades]